MAPSHYLNQCSLIVNWIPRNKLQWNLNQNTKLFIQQENVFEKVVCKMSAILSRERWVNKDNSNTVVSGQCINWCTSNINGVVLFCCCFELKHLRFWTSGYTSLISWVEQGQFEDDAFKNRKVTDSSGVRQGDRELIISLSKYANFIGIRLNSTLIFIYLKRDEIWHYAGIVDKGNRNLMAVADILACKWPPYSSSGIWPMMIMPTWCPHNDYR